MERITFLLDTGGGRFLPPPGAPEELKALGAENFSLWGAAGFVFGYLEADGDAGEIKRYLNRLLGSQDARVLAAPGDMRLMFDLPGDIQPDKGRIRHRVFMTRLKPGMAEEYRSRHDALKARRGEGRGGVESNFTIWNAGDIICGYCELIKERERQPTDAERRAAVDWETRQLEIMDWITDDVDRLTGRKNAAVERLL